MPVWKPGCCATVGVAADAVAHAHSANSAMTAQWTRSIITLLPFVAGDLRLCRVAAGMNLESVHVPAAAIDLLVGAVAELDVMRVRRQRHGFRLPAVAGTRQHAERLPVDAVR